MKTKFGTMELGQYIRFPGQEVRDSFFLEVHSFLLLCSWTRSICFPFSRSCSRGANHRYSYHRSQGADYLLCRLPFEGSDDRLSGNTISQCISEGVLYYFILDHIIEVFLSLCEWDVEKSYLRYGPLRNNPLCGSVVYFEGVMSLF
jgi:hypothetical protein